MPSPRQVGVGVATKGADMAGEQAISWILSATPRNLEEVQSSEDWLAKRLPRVMTLLAYLAYLCFP